MFLKYNYISILIWYKNILRIKVLYRKIVCVIKHKIITCISFLQRKWLLELKSKSKFHSPHSSESHKAPPEGVKKWPWSGRIVLLSKINQGCKCKDCNSDQQHQETQLFVSLVESVNQGLKTSKMSDKFEYSHDSHPPHESHYLTRFTHYFKVLEHNAPWNVVFIKIQWIYDTWRPPITRSNINGIIAKKSTKFIGCLKNLHFLGEQINLTRYSIRKNSTIAFSANKIN